MFKSPIDTNHHIINMSEVEINVKNPKLQRTLQRFKQKISEGDYYEAHQTLRTIANRNVRTKSYGDAIELLYHAAQILLKSSQPATGSDLTTYLLEIYDEAEIPVDSSSKSKIIQLISLFTPDEPTLKNVSIQAINWTVKFGEYKFGDPYLHDVIGEKFLQNASLAYDAERHLILGTSASFPLYYKLIWTWYLEDPNSKNAGVYVSRLVLNYLFIENIKYANEALSKFIQDLISTKTEFSSETLKESENEVFIFEDLPLINFLQLLLVSVQTKNAPYYQKLKNRYQQDINLAELDDAFSYIGEVYFGIRVQKNINPLQNLMSSFLGGGF